MIAAITGANGFVGRALVRHFTDAGYVVRPVVRHDYKSGNVDTLFAGARVVVHAAGATRAPTHGALHASNVELTAATLDAASRAGVQRFVFISSQAAAGPAVARDAPVTERDPAMPVEAYGRSKLAAERLVAESGVPWVTLRPAAIYGPFDRDFLALHAWAARGVAIHPGNRHQWISIVHVDDVADAVVRAAMEARAVGDVFFLANHEPVQWSTLFRDAAACAGKRLTVDVELPTSIVNVAAKFCDVAARVRGRAGLLTTEKLALARPPYWVCSSAHARETLGFDPQIALGRGLCDTHRWYRAQRWI